MLDSHANANGYNLEFGGNSGKELSSETKAKISAHHADVSNEKNPMFGKKHTQEAIEKCKNHPNYINRKVKGENNHLAKVSEENARKIKSYFSDGHELYKGEVRDVAEKYGVSTQIVSHIKNGHAWAWL